MKIHCLRCFKEYPNLESRRCSCGGTIAPSRGGKADQYWTRQRLKDMFGRYFKENGHFPSGWEIDNCPYLPASRSIQRTFGGLVQFRKSIGLEITDYSSGESRALVASDRNAQARLSENNAHNEIVNIFGKVCVHREEPSYGVNGRYFWDIYIYAKPLNIGIDVFMPKDKGSLSGCINIKLRKFQKVECRSIKDNFYFINLNPKFSQEYLNNLIKNKKVNLPKNLSVMDYQSFIKKITDDINDGRIVKYVIY